MADTRFSFFLTPRGAALEKLSKLIERLAIQLSSPIFEPHVTLLSSMPLPLTETISKTKELASALRPFTIRLNKVVHEDIWNKAIFINAEQSKKLMEANAKAREAFGLEDYEYLPHLSILYGEFPVETKERLIKDIGPELDIKFEAKSIRIWDTVQSPWKWKFVKEIPLG
ncbi:MAG: 2'-5' RNA ligase family protein [Nanoarchaeota archaeon]|nr:2'-5' RNA ligase family protein [Nanoarchaeota archaeon]